MKESEKLVRKALERTKKNRTYLNYLQIVFIIAMLMVGVALIVYANVAKIDTLQVGDEWPKECISCAKQMSHTVTEETLPKCKPCLNEMSGYNQDWVNYVGNLVGGIAIVFVIYLLSTLVSSTQRDLEITQLKLEHALEIDKLKQGKKGGK